MKKPSVKGMKNLEYMKHFTKDKFIQDGHNTVAEPRFQLQYKGKRTSVTMPFGVGNDEQKMGEYASKVNSDIDTNTQGLTEEQKQIYRDAVKKEIIKKRNQWEERQRQDEERKALDKESNIA